MRILYIEPFSAGSHAAFGTVLTQGLDAQWTTLTLPGRHWKWRMRGSAAYFATEHADTLAQHYDLLLASSYVPLAELVGLAPTLATIPRVLYFHENQLAYPGRGVESARDHHFGFTQIVSALAASCCVFNSAFNRDSFLRAAEALLKRMPDARLRGWAQFVRARSRVLPVPLPLSDAPVAPAKHHADGPLLLWNHRWEHDKNPQTCMRALADLACSGARFRVAVCGEQFRRVPEVFGEVQAQLRARAVQWGQASQSRYNELLDEADVVLSTAHHEFLGVAVIEAVHRGARPLVPARLAYREIWPRAFAYANDEQFRAALGRLLRASQAGVPLRANRRVLTRAFDARRLIPRYARLFESLVRGLTSSDG